MGTTAEKGAYLNETKSQIKTAINNLGGNIDSETTFREYVEELQGVYDNYPKTSYGEGTSVTLENCNKGKLDFDKLEGDTEQDSTNGYQLINIEDTTTEVAGVTITISGGVITINGTASRNNTFQFNAKTTTTLNGDYILASNYVSGTRSGDANFNVRDNSTSSAIFNVSLTTSQVTNIASLNNTIKYGIYVASGATFNNYTFKPMLESGSTAHEWEKYTKGASPNPDYPQEIKTITGNQTVTVRGKNYFDNSITPSVQNGPDVPIATGKRVSYTGTNGGTRFNAYAIMDLTNFTGSTIRFKSKFIPSNENLGNYYIGLCDSEGNNKTTLSNASGVNEKEVSFVVPQLEGTKKYLCLGLYMNSGGTLAQNDYVDYTNMILTIDDEDMTYEPYYKITKQLSLGNKELFEDSFISRENGDFYFNDNWKRLILDGTESGWQYSSDTIILTSINDYYKELDAVTIYSTIYQGLGEKSSAGALADMNNVIALGSSTSNYRLYIKDNRYTNINDYKTYLGTNNLNIVYKLATPIKTKITDTTLISQLEDIWSMMSINGTTIVESDGDLPLIIKVRALKGE